MICNVIITTLSFLLLCSVIYSIFITKIAMRRTDKLEEMIEQVEQSLDILDAAYINITGILETPVGSDDPFVKNVILTIKAARDSILLIANNITLPISNNENAQEK